MWLHKYSSPFKSVFSRQSQHWVCVSKSVMHKDQVWTAAPEHWPLCLHYTVCFRSLSWCDISFSFRVKQIVLKDFSVFVLHQFGPLPLQVSCWESSSQHHAAATTWNYIFVLMWCVWCSPHVSTPKEKKCSHLVSPDLHAFDLWNHVCGHSIEGFFFLRHWKALTGKGSQMPLRLN